MSIMRDRQSAEGGGTGRSPVSRIVVLIVPLLLAVLGVAGAPGSARALGQDRPDAPLHVLETVLSARSAGSGHDPAGTCPADGMSVLADEDGPVENASDGSDLAGPVLAVLSANRRSPRRLARLVRAARPRAVMSDLRPRRLFPRIGARPPPAA